MCGKKRAFGNQPGLRQIIRQDNGPRAQPKAAGGIVGIAIKDSPQRELLFAQAKTVPRRQRQPVRQHPFHHATLVSQCVSQRHGRVKFHDADQRVKIINRADLRKSALRFGTAFHHDH